MNHEILILQGAQSDLFEIFSEHGSKVANQIDLVLSLISENPEMAPVFENPVRRKVVSQTPFGIFYVVESQRVAVWGVIDLRQEPRFIRKKLGLI